MVSEIVIVAHLSLQGNLWTKLLAAMIKCGADSCLDKICVASNGLQLLAWYHGRYTSCFLYSMSNKAEVSIAAIGTKLLRLCPAAISRACQAYPRIGHVHATVEVDIIGLDASLYVKLTIQ